jgi:hypothetical protein
MEVFIMMITMNDLCNFSMTTLEELYNYYNKQYALLWETYWFTYDESVFETNYHKDLETMINKIDCAMKHKKAILG